MDACKVSFIIPVYNAAETIERCLETVLNQTFRDIEVLAVNDGSTDSSLEKLKAIAARDSRLRVLTKANSGVASARNLAINEASGDYLQFVDSDDTLPLDATERMVNAMAQPDCDMVIAPYWEVVGNHSAQRGFLAEERVLHQREFLDRFSEYPNSFFYAVLWNKLYRRSIIIKNSLRNDLRLPWGEDFAFNTQYYRYVRNVAVIAQPVYSYNRTLQGLALSTARRTMLHPFDAIEQKFYLQHYYNELFRATGLFSAYKRVLPRYLFRITINR